MLRTLVALVALVALVVLSPAACKRRPPPGTCASDLDCPPSFDCHGGTCLRRVRLDFAAPEASAGRLDADAGAAGLVAPPPSLEQGSDPPWHSASGTEDSDPKDAASESRPAAPRTRDVPPAPPPPPSPSPPATPPPGHLPAWKQRLKNS